MTRPALGKGLEALIPGAKKTQDAAKNGSMSISVAEIKANPNQPRKNFTSAGMEEMIKSIKEKGVIQPIILRETGDKYEIVAGERRFLGAVKAGLRAVPALIMNVSPVESLEIAMIENVHRQDLNQIEEANGYKLLMDSMHLTQEQLADKIGKNRSTVTNMLRLLKLPKTVQDRLIGGEIEPGHAKVLLGITDESKMKAVCEQVVKRGMSVRDLEKMLSREKKPKTTVTKADLSEMRGLESKMKHLFGTKVTIKGNNKKGRLEIEYYSQEDFERILEALDIKL